MSTAASNLEPAEVTDLVRFLQATPPFYALAREQVARVARQLNVTYVPSGTCVLDVGEDTDVLSLVRSGAVELTNESGALVAQLGEGEFFGYPALLTGAPARRRVVAIEDTLLYLIPEAEFDRLRSASDTVDRFFARAHSDRIHDAVREEQQGMPLATPLRALLSRDPVTAAPDVPIRRAAETMRDARVSCLLLCDGDALVGLVTDRDLRNRALAGGRDPEEPIRSIMTANPVTVTADQFAFEALLTMSRRNVHHLPVMDGSGQVAGVVTATDLMRLQADNPVYVVGEVWKQDTLDGLVDVSRRIPQVVVDLVQSGARADDVARVVTAVSDALTERLLAMAEAELGPPPVPYAWLALGSQARFEQTAHSDQDNALLLSNDATDAHDDYFHQLATVVCDGLNACGYEYCPGEVMATTDRWRQPLKGWKRTFRTWIDEPTPKALMHATIFFDLRHIHGTPSLTRELRSFILDRTAQNSIFLACLTTNALESKVPLGFFRQFVLTRHGDHEDALDLKHNGVVPIVDIARIYALAHGVGAVNTRERLKALADNGRMNAGDAADLRDALAFIAQVRLEHQAAQIADGDEPDNFVAPRALSDFERRHLKDAFKMVSTMQSALGQRYQTSFLT